MSYLNAKSVRLFLILYITLSRNVRNGYTSTSKSIFSGSGLALTKEDRTSVNTSIDKVGAIAASIVEDRATKKYFLFI
jgi:hypothetical protein